ncbi:MAG: hypothetical protein JWR53_978 [Glaciihabitans sp.]|nr:hypothetical protein [Glaciihabitans sp.]
MSNGTASGETTPAGPPPISEFDALLGGAIERAATGQVATAPPPASPVVFIDVASPPRLDVEPAPVPAELSLELRPRSRRARASILDWVALGLSVLAPPVGLLADVAAIVVGLRSNGWVSGVAKTATGLAIALTLVLTGGGIVLGNAAKDAAAHNAIVASGVKYCSALRTDPATLSSNDFGWPPVGATVADSIVAMNAFEAKWVDLEKLAPAGVKGETTKVADAAKQILTSVQSSQTLDASTNADTMAQVRAASGIPTWVAEYCS